MNKQWYYAEHEESECWDGGYDNKNDAIADCLKEYGEGVVCLASPFEFSLSSFVLIDDILEIAEESIEEYKLEDEVVFDVPTHLLEDLKNQIHETIKAWEENSGIVFTSNMLNFHGDVEYVLPIE